MGKGERPGWGYGRHRIRTGDRYQERFRGAKLVLNRAWFLLLPLIGIVAANQAYVRPNLDRMQDTQKTERRRAQTEEDSVRAKTSALRLEVAGVKVVIDTLYSPRIMSYETMLDSLRAVREAYGLEEPDARRAIDSLQVECDLTRSATDRLAVEFRRKIALRDSLDTRRSALNDSLARLDERIVARMELLYRLGHPKESARGEPMPGALPAPAAAPQVRPGRR